MSEPTSTSAAAATTHLNAHIFGVSAALVGVCITVIGLFRIIVRSQHVDSVADNILAIDALLFLTACFFSYLGLRAPTDQSSRRRERVADVFFLAALTLMAVVGILIAYEVV